MQDNQLAVPVSDGDHHQGQLDAPVTLVEYGDFECPYCGQAYGIVKAIQQQFGDQLCFVFREFPLTQIHPYAEQAAEAAEAAGAQGRFWPMHDLLYENQQALDIPDLERYAAEIGLDRQQFDQALQQHAFADKVHEQFIGGVRSGVNGTPTFFVNGERYDGSWDEDSLSQAIGGLLHAGHRR
jgi:protein-disulfide isomerase